MISGIVANSATGEPVPRALVTLSPSIGALIRGKPLPPPRQVFSDATGAFQFVGLAAGEYRLGAQRPQFQPGRESSAISVGPSRRDAEVKLDPLSSIEGTVIASEGFPVQGVSVEAVESTVVGGVRRYTAIRTVPTDDRGHYRMWNMSPGTYYVRLAGRMGGTRGFLTDAMPPMEWPEVLAPVYYGHVTERTAATPLQVAPGQQITADFREPLRPAHKVRGAIGNFVPQQKATIQLLTPEGEKVSARIAVNLYSGRFEANDVTEGDYRLRVTQGDGESSMRGEVPFHMGQAALDGLQVTLQRGVDVHVAPTCEGGGAGAEESGCGMIALLTEVQDGTVRMAVADRGGSQFIAHDVYPGSYRVSVRPMNGHVVAARMGSTELNATSTVLIQPGLPPEPIEITVRRAAGVVDCRIEMAQPPASLALLAVPDAETIEELDIANRGQSGVWQFRSLAPGDYTIFALPDQGSVPYQDPEVRRTFRNGVRVRVSEGSTVEARITGLAL